MNINYKKEILSTEASLLTPSYIFPPKARSLSPRGKQYAGRHMERQEDSEPGISTKRGREGGREEGGGTDWPDQPARVGGILINRFVQLIERVKTYSISW